MTHILHHSIYQANPYGHGGEKRSAQLKEYFAGKGDAVSSLRLDLNVAPKFSYIIKALYWVLKILGVRAWKNPYVFLRYVKHVAIWLPQLEKYFSQIDVTTFYWESTRDTYYILPFIARKYNKKVVAFPHNLEALVPDQQSSLFRYNRKLAFKRELEVLGICDEVYCIASEESWLLRLWGINASFLPYLPPREMQKQLTEIKEKRNEVVKKYYLILGFAINPPTLQGMIELLENLKATTIPIVVAGYQTEQLQSYATTTLRIKGTVTQEELQELMLGAKALLINQPPTTGALTRIEEFFQAGIPVYVNEASMRSYWNRLNVFCYCDFDELKKYCNGKCSSDIRFCSPI